MPTCPGPVYVEAPPVEPYRFGLFSVASFPQDREAIARIECGVEYEPVTCSPAQLTHDACRTEALDGTPVAAPPAKAPEGGVPYVAADGFTIYAGFDCKVIGRTLQDMERRAREALRLGAQRAVELGYWTGQEGNRPRLADPDAVLIGDGLTALRPEAALAALECYLGETYAGTGVIHAPRGSAALLDGRGVLRQVGNRLETILGTRFAAGGGYCVNTGPDGAEAPAGTAWWYATGQVAIWHGEPWINPDDIRLALDRRTNDLAMVVEQSWVVSHECSHAAVLVDVSC